MDCIDLACSGMSDDLRRRIRHRVYKEFYLVQPLERSRSILKRPHAPKRALAKMAPLKTNPRFQRNDIRDFLSFFLGVLDKHQDMELAAGHFWDVLYTETNIHLPESSDENLSEAFEGPRMRFKSYANMLMALQKLTASFEAEMRRIETQMTTTALHRGIRGLPDELLSVILGFAASSFQEACQMSHVCARFRSVVLSTPRIWANCEVTLQSTTKQLAAILDRSRTMLLKARVEPNLYFPKSAKGILDHAARIEELHVSPVNVQALHDDFHAVRLPALRYLYMSWSKCVPGQYIDKPTTHVYETWTMPQLQYIETNFIPRSIPGTSIVQCKLTFDTSAIYVSELLEFLASSPSLEVLDVSFVGTSAWQEKRADPIVSLRNLTSLTLTSSAKTSTPLFNRILRQLHCENVSEVSVIMKEKLRTEEEYDSAFEVVADPADVAAERMEFKYRSDAVYSFIRRHQSIERLSLLVDMEGNGCEEQIPSYILQQLIELFAALPKKLTTLVLMRSIVVRWDTTRKDCIEPPLDFLCITDGNKWMMELVRAFTRVALHKNTQPRRIELTGCVASHEEGLRQLFPESRVVCSPGWD